MLVAVCGLLIVVVSCVVVLLLVCWLALSVGCDCCVCNVLLGGLGCLLVCVCCLLCCGSVVSCVVWCCVRVV